MEKELIAHKDPKSPISEIFRTLRTNIQFMNTDKKMKTLLVTSTFPGEGKSWVTSNLAITFAQAGKRVILIDADMRKGRQYKLFGVSPRPGLSNLLSETEVDEDGNLTENVADYIQETEVNNLFVISAGNVPPNPSELLVSAQMLRLLEELKDYCDIVILDGTPCELVTDSIILSRIVDYTLVVTAHKIAKKEALARVIRNIKNVGGKFAGIVVNKMPVSTKRYGQQYYYYGKSESANKAKNKSFIDLKKNSSANRQIERMETLRRQNFSTAKKREGYPKDIPIKSNTRQTDNIKQRPKEENSGPMSIDKTNDILKQINDYLDKEKKDLT